METLKLSAEEIRHIALFESITGAVTRDCLIGNSGGTVTFIVKEGDMGLAIGKRGGNVQRVRQALGKKVEIIEYSNDPAEFIKNILNPLRVRNVEVTEKDNKTVARVTVDHRDRARAIGRGGKSIQRIRALLQRHHEISDVVIV